MKKILFIVVWLLILSLGPITIYQNTPISNLFLSNSAIANTLQRFLGLTAFSLLFIQIVLGFFMDKAERFFGKWLFKFHIIQGILIYFLIILHGLAFVYFNYVIFQRFDPFYIFIDVCALCASRLDHYYNLGRIGFWFITFVVLAGLFKSFNLWMKKNWRNVHYLNYIAFLFIGVHAYFVGDDITKISYSYFHRIGMAIILMLSLVKLLKFLKKKP